MVPDDPPAEPSPNNIEDAPEKKKNNHSVRMITIFVLCALSHILTLRYVSTSATPSVESTKWKPRHVSLPHPPNFTDLQNGSLDVLDTLIVKATLSVVVYYAPWSRASHKILNNIEQLSPYPGNVSFIAINCWLYKSQCKEAYNSWEYPQIVLYHTVLNHTPYIYSMTTHPASLAVQIQRLVTPVISVESYKDLIDLALSHQQTIIGYFDSSDTTQLDQYTKAATQHHLEYMDTYYVPFVIITDLHFLSIVGVRATPLIFRYTMFQPLEEFENSGFFSARLLLNWVYRQKSQITYLNYRTFPSVLSLARQSIIFSSPLSSNTQLYQDYVRFVLSYRHCMMPDPRRGLSCDQNKTCVNPCTTPSFSSAHSVVSCLHNRPVDHLLRHCFSLRSGGGRSDRVGVLGDDCPLAEEVNETKDMLSAFFRMRESHHLSPVHSTGCRELGADGLKFYALDSVQWYGMLDRFGVTNASRSSEAILKLSSREQTVERYTLDGQDTVSFEEFVLGDTSQSKQQHSEWSYLHSRHIQDVDRDELEEVLDQPSLDVVVLTYTTWCGFCKTLWAKVESLAVLLEHTPRLRFVSINLDQNELDEVDIRTDRVPGLYFSFSGHSEILPFPSNSTFTLSNILAYIKHHIHIKTRARGRFPQPAPSPCGRWRPLVLKQSEPVHWPHDLGLSDYTIFDVLEGTVDNTVDLSQEGEEEERAFSKKERLTSTEPTQMRCDLDRYLIKLLAQHNSDPALLSDHIQTTLVNNLLLNDCLTGEAEFWDVMVIECYNSVGGFACEHLVLAHMIQQFHNPTPDTVLTVLKSLSHPQPDITQCYNVKAELAYYLTHQCSLHCTRSCRLVHRL